MGERRVFVVGGGTMGRGIAGLCALSDYRTSVFETDPATRGALRGSIQDSWDRAAARGKVSPQNVTRAGALLSIAHELEEAAAAEIVLEAVPESLELKREVLARLDRICPPQALLASNTSSLSIRKIAQGTRHPERVLGIHFFNPVAAMPLVEVVRSSETSREIEATALAFVGSLGKEVLRVRDSPGFATSRLGLALGLEAMRMVEEEVASAEDLDRAMELGYGHRLGPLKTSDLVGLDVRLAIAEILSEELDANRFAPPAILRRLVAEGQTGKKAGEGFFRWEGDTAIPREAPTRAKGEKP